VSRAADLKENTILAFEKDFAVVEAPRHVHHTIGPDQVVTAWDGGLDRPQLLDLV
jgi:hypothetical protein